MAPKQVIWNLKASEERWQKLRTNIQRNVENTRMIMSDTAVDITTRYRKYRVINLKCLFLLSFFGTSCTARTFIFWYVIAI